MHPFIIPGSLFVLSVMFLWAVYSSYVRHIRLVQRRDSFREHLERSESITFTCIAKAVDYAKIKMARVGVQSIVKPYEEYTYPESVEYALGHVKDYVYDYYKIYEIEPMEYLEGLNECVNSNKENIQDAELCWGIIYDRLVLDANTFIQSTVCFEGSENISKDTGRVFGFFIPVEKEEYEAAKEDVSVYSITLRPFNTNLNFIKELQKKDTKGKMKIEEIS